MLNEAKTPPFALDNTAGINEEVRLKYRYLDLRSQRMLKNLILRDTVTSASFVRISCTMKVLSKLRRLA
jgi:aspartyl-tRNA synthetase